MPGSPRHGNRIRGTQGREHSSTAPSTTCIGVVRVPASRGACSWLPPRAVRWCATRNGENAAEQDAAWLYINLLMMDPYCDSRSIASHRCSVRASTSAQQMRIHPHAMCACRMMHSRSRSAINVISTWVEENVTRGWIARSGTLCRCSTAVTAAAAALRRFHCCVGPSCS